MLHVFLNIDGDALSMQNKNCRQVVLNTIAERVINMLHTEMIRKW